MIIFKQTKRGIVFEYTPEFGGSSTWVNKQLDDHGEVTISRVFTFEQKDLLPSEDVVDDFEIDEERTYRFRFARRKGDYFKISGRKLGSDADVNLVAEGLKIERKLFVAERNISVFRRISRALPDTEAVYIGGTHENAIPIKAFNELLQRFPNSLELDRYANARVEALIGDFVDQLGSEREKYEQYLSRRSQAISDAPLQHMALLQAELDKFCYIRDTVVEWLKVATSYSEQDWQKMIIKIILLLFPKYVAVLENVKIPDSYSDPSRTKNRFIDICLVDASGYVDVIEVKKPFDDIMLGKSKYRDNSVPTRELSGTVVQAEKYLFHLSKWGVKGEKALQSRYVAELPAGLKLRIANPKAIIVAGRDQKPTGGNAFSAEQKLDLEIIKRHYANVMDIMTYDDTLRRLDNIIASLEQRKSTL